MSGTIFIRLWSAVNLKYKRLNLTQAFDNNEAQTRTLNFEIMGKDTNR